MIHKESRYRSLSRDLQELEDVGRGVLDGNKTKSNHDSLRWKKRIPSEIWRGGVIDSENKRRMGRDSENKRQMGRENHRPEAIMREIVAVG